MAGLLVQVRNHVLRLCLRGWGIVLTCCFKVKINKSIVLKGANILFHEF